MTKVQTDKSSVRQVTFGHQPETLKHKVYTQIREGIIFGEFLAGQKLIERELCALTGSSRSVLREALVHLERDGLLERRSYSGFSVIEISARNIREIFELRCAVETFAAELFTERASDQEIASLVDAFQGLEACFADGTMREIWSAKTRYYDILFSGCRNEEIKKALGSVTDKIGIMRNVLLSNEQRRAESIDEMRALTDAIAARDIREARSTCLSHIVSARDTMLDRLAGL